MWSRQPRVVHLKQYKSMRAGSITRDREGRGAPGKFFPLSMHLCTDLAGSHVKRVPLPIWGTRSRRRFVLHASKGLASQKDSSSVRMAPQHFYELCAVGMHVQADFGACLGGPDAVAGVLECGLIFGCLRLCFFLSWDNASVHAVAGHAVPDLFARLQPPRVSVDVTTRTRAHTPRAHVTHSQRLLFCKFRPRSRRRLPAFPTKPSSPPPSPTSSGPFSAALCLCSLRSDDCVAPVIARQCTHASTACGVHDDSAGVRPSSKRSHTPPRLAPTNLETRKPRFPNRFVSARPERKHPAPQWFCTRLCSCPCSARLSRVRLTVACPCPV